MRKKNKSSLPQKSKRHRGAAKARTPRGAKTSTNLNTASKTDAQPQTDEGSQGSCTEEVAEALGELKQGIVTANYGSEVLVRHADKEARCYYRSKLDLAVGDRVLWRDKPTGLGVIESLQARQSQIQRPDSYGNLRTVAANVTQLLITIAEEPEAHSALIDSYLVAASLHRLQPVILINKCDLSLGEKLTELEARYKHLGYPVLRVSATTQEGLRALAEQLQQHTSIFVGQSGVGKSSLVKVFFPDKDIRIGELSKTELQGRHTTTHSQLFYFPDGGVCIDSPGIRDFGLWHATPGDVLAGFKEIYQLSAHCKFRNCRHKNEPQCAVIDAVKTGAIHPERFQNYQRIIDQLDDVMIKNN